jgi:hypothetical protein
VANLTLTIDDSVLRRARVRAVLEGTSVNAVVRELIERYAGDAQGDEAMRRILEAARRSRASSGAGGRAWTRDEAHDRADLR